MKNKFERLKNGLQKTKKKLFDGLTEVVTRKAVLDENVIEEIEELLISADIGTEITDKIITKTKKDLLSKDSRDSNSIKEVIIEELKNILTSSISSNKNDKTNENKPLVYLIVGVNGVGKTTTIGKLANKFNEERKKVILGAADTFRAAAGEQLDIWAKRAGVDIITAPGKSPSTVVYKTVEKAIKENYDVAFIDTAGRLHTKSNLMEELNKIKRVITKLIGRAPDMTLLVLDSTNGQNSIFQAEEFNKFTELDGLILTKLDGTAKGGIVFQIIDSLNIPIKYIGVGEGIEDLQDFEPDLFLDALLN